MIILSLDPQTTDPQNACRPEAVGKAVGSQVNFIHFFQGTSLITGDAHDRLFFWDLNRPEIKIQLQNTSAEVRV